jgi:hypothetical protein
MLLAGLVNAVGSVVTLGVGALVIVPLKLAWQSMATLIAYREVVGLSEQDLAPYL